MILEHFLTYLLTVYFKMSHQDICLSFQLRARAHMGLRLVSPERVKAMSRLITDSFDVVGGEAARRGMGYRLGEVAGSAYGSRVSAFGHGGAGGSYGLADPEIGLSIGVTLNKMMIELDPVKERAAKICQLIRSEITT
jgi:CubicO group peptidase (beta-lactamase class C family)